MIRDIVVYPDKRLKQVSQEVKVFDENLHTLLDDMYETMVAKNGVGLASIQIAVPKQVLIINIPIDVDDNKERDQPKENTLEMINPVIIDCSGSAINQEGCLSVPKVYEDIERYKYIKVDFFDRYGEKHTIETDEFLAVAIQHEMEHLNGKLFIEKFSYIKRKKFEKEWKKRKRDK
ncbi:Peptide deformylase [hydrothermal vent metagenome]|uniref:Peptide deformylase n=1 Tax=hydrothermal vent metagenome TaxID=652676 RepID=A0A1W1C9K2_9ZZZZ